MPQGTPNASSGDPSVHMVFRATHHEVRVALIELAGTLQRGGLPRDQLLDVELVVAELCNNVVEHAYPDPGGGRIDLRVRVDHGRVHISVGDSGRAMCSLPAGSEPPALPALRDDLPEGGFGWFLIRQLSCDIRHDVLAGGNRISVVVAPREPRQQ